MVFMYIRYQAAVKPIESTNIDLIKEVPIEFQTVYSYVERCLLLTTVDGLKVIGEHGGYLDPAASGMVVAENPTDGSAVDLISGSGMEIPYWYYLKSDNKCSGNCAFTPGFPYLRKNEGSPSIEEELQKYIDQNIGTCLANFSSLQEQGFTLNDMKDYKSDVQITGDNVLVFLDYSLSVKSNSVEHQFKRFATEVPVNMDRVYSLAKQLTEYEMQYNYIEKHEANMLVAYSGLDKDIPPIADVTFQFGSETTWQKDKVKEAVENILESNVPLLQVQNTKNFKERVMRSSTITALYNRGTNIPNSLTTNDMNVYFTYYRPPAGWDIYFDLNCKDNLCRPMSISSNLVALMGIQRYKFFYDISNPVLVEINSPDELVNYIPNGYRFKFFLESNIRDNSPLSASYTQLKQNDFGATMFCDQDKRNSGNINISVKDFEGNPVDSVSVVYKCGDDSCVIGNTGSDGVLVSKFPLCVGGVVVFLKTDYNQYSLPFNVGLDETKMLKVTVGQILDKRISIVKKMIIKSGDKWQLSPASTQLDPDEEAFVIMTKIATPTGQPDSAFADLTGINPESDITLSPGKYNVKTTMTLNETITIPDSVRNGVEIKGTKMDQPMSGGLDMNITLTDEDLKKSKITIVALGLDLRNFNSLNDMESFGLIQNYSERYADELKPIIT